MIYLGYVLYALTSLTAATVVTPRDPPATYGPWTSLGCWVDSPVNRTLHVAMGGSSTNTVETCLDACSAAGYPLGGVEFGSECFCGNAILYNYGLSESGCSFSCSGNPDEICGGAGAINIYHNGDLPYTVGPAMAVYSYGGYSGYFNDVYEGLCYRYNSFTGGLNELKFPPVPQISIENMTVENCINGCRAGGYYIAGLRYGQECWCDAKTFWKLPLGENRPNAACNIPCTGDATQFCGGTNNLLAYYGHPY
ncbi:hypothetical protein Hypma_000329 [Hypsizygus marmoreus]|uniref:WSC domain-containing protein n=1 Tax=Hypsizygus marmoreus TaxID=39966 RepID=A0A369JB65_HYPMA|nr:hypothetical protein Hypma_000329 [Hypsizygus marmoreus]